MSAAAVADTAEAWLAGESEAPSLDELAAYAAALADDPALAAGEIEERLAADLDTAIFEAEHDLAHGSADADTRRRLTDLRLKRERLSAAWGRALLAAEYRADKLDELAGAPDAATAAEAVTRWNLLDGGPEALRLPGSLFPDPEPEIAPPGPLPSARAAEVHASVLRHSARFFSRAEAAASGAVDAPHRPRNLLTAETGSRKTGITLTQFNARSEGRKAAGLPHRGVMLVPAHRLGREILGRAQAEGINAALFRGRGDPAKPDQPCCNLEAVTLAQQAGADIRTAVCGPDAGGRRCDWRFGSCATDGYFGGLARAAAADLVIAAHNYLFEPLPRELLEGVAWVIVDEGFTALGDRIFDLTLDTLAPESLAKFPRLDETGSPDAQATAALQHLYDMVREAARSCIDNYPTADALRAAGFTAVSDAPARMRKESWERKVPVAMQPGMDPEARKEAARAAAINGQLPRIAALTYALEAILTKGAPAAGLVSVRLDLRRSGSQTVLTVRGQREPAAWLADLPVLMLNATGRIEDVRRIFPDAELAEAPRAAWPHVAVHQVIGGFGKSVLARHPKRLAELRDFISVATLGQSSALVVTHKACEDAFAGMPGIETAHFGDVAGSDKHGHVESAFVIGGAFPAPEEVASIAAARGGGAVIAAPPERVTRAGLLCSGAAVPVEVMAYADPAADAVHRGIYDTSIIQAAGRLRPLERTANTPAVLWQFGNTALPFPGLDVRPWREVRPDRLVRMVAGYSVWLNPPDMAAFRKDLFRSAKAAEHVRGRIEDAREAVRAVVRHDRQPWSEFLYQVRGQGMKLRTAIAPSGAEATIKAAVEAEHGEVVRWLALPFTHGREVVPEPGNQGIFPAPGMTSRAEPASAPIHAGLTPESAYRMEHPPDG